MQKRIELPEPTPDARAHSESVAAHIRQRIRAAGGWVDFAEFMDMALYAPGLGYYSAGSVKLGPAGDFITAPEISPLFARCVARACAATLAEDRRRVILEIGAGTGALAAELLLALARLDASPARYLILEVSADLRERQRRTLEQSAPGLLSSVEWLDRLPDAPVQGLVLANEVADALPVSRFTKQDGALLAAGVVEYGNGFAWATRPADERLHAAVARIEHDLGGRIADGYSSEICLRMPVWIAAVAAGLEVGTFLLFDYGMSRREYYHHDRRDGTLTCHYRHRAHDGVFLYPGLQDITAWVDFTAVAESAAAAGLAVSGYATQGHFLLDSGIDEELARVTGAAGISSLEYVRQAKQLVLPGEMGERFKVIALTRGDSEIGGFGFRDLRHLL